MLWLRKSAPIPCEMEGLPGLGEPVGQPARHEHQQGDKGVQREGGAYARTQGS